MKLIGSDETRDHIKKISYELVLKVNSSYSQGEFRSNINHFLKQFK